MAKDLALGPHRRVKHRQDFLRIQKQGRKLRAPHFLLSIVARNPDEQSRIGVTITTKVHKRAVKRNKLKRRIRHLFRTHRASLRAPVDIVVIALTGATELGFTEVRDEFLEALERGRLLGRMKDKGRKS